MSKGIIKKIALLVAFVLAFSFVATACSKTATETSPAADSSAAGTSAAATADAAAKSYTIGVNTWGSGVPILDMFGDNAEYTLKVLGNTTTRASDDFTADKELANVQNFCSAGVQGIALQAAAVTTLPQIAKVCQDAKVPFVMFTFIGSDEDRTKLADSNPYYVGAVDADMITDGKAVADMAIADGCKTAVLIGGNIGDNNMDQRSQGFRDEFIAKGGTILNEARCTDASECATKAEDMLSANKEADCLYAMVGDYIPGSLSAIDNLGLAGDIKVYLSCVDLASAQYIKEGKIAGGNDGIVLASYIGPTLLINYLDGHPILDENGKPPRLQTIPFAVNKDNVDDYMSMFTTEGVHPVADDVLKSLCFRFNPDVTYQTYVDLLTKGLTLDAILAAHK